MITDVVQGIIVGGVLAFITASLLINAEFTHLTASVDDAAA